MSRGAQKTAVVTLTMEMSEEDLDLLTQERKQKCTKQWEEHNIFSDEQLQALPESGWVSNSWFDCYNADTGEHFAAVQHDIYEALAQAAAILEEDELWEVA